MVANAVPSLAACLAACLEDLYVLSSYDASQVFLGGCFERVEDGGGSCAKRRSASLWSVLLSDSGWNN
jgi:hypothetical protein